MPAWLHTPVAAFVLTVTRSTSISSVQSNRQATGWDGKNPNYGAHLDVVYASNKSRFECLEQSDYL